MFSINESQLKNFWIENDNNFGLITSSNFLHRYQNDYFVETYKIETIENFEYYNSYYFELNEISYLINAYEGDLSTGFLLKLLDYETKTEICEINSGNLEFFSSIANIFPVEIDDQFHIFIVGLKTFQWKVLQ